MPGTRPGSLAFPAATRVKSSDAEALRKPPAAPPPCPTWRASCRRLAQTFSCGGSREHTSYRDCRRRRRRTGPGHRTGQASRTQRQGQGHPGRCLPDPYLEAPAARGRGRHHQLVRRRAELLRPRRAEPFRVPARPPRRARPRAQGHQPGAAGRGRWPGAGRRPRTGLRHAGAGTGLDFQRLRHTGRARQLHLPRLARPGRPLPVAVPQHVPARPRPAGRPGQPGRAQHRHRRRRRHRRRAGRRTAPRRAQVRRVRSRRNRAQPRQHQPDRGRRPHPAGAAAGHLGGCAPAPGGTGHQGLHAPEDHRHHRAGPAGRERPVHSRLAQGLVGRHQGRRQPARDRRAGDQPHQPAGGHADAADHARCQHLRHRRLRLLPAAGRRAPAAAARADRQPAGHVPAQGPAPAPGRQVRAGLQLPRQGLADLAEQERGRRAHGQHRRAGPLRAPDVRVAVPPAPDGAARPVQDRGDLLQGPAEQELGADAEAALRELPHPCLPLSGNTPSLQFPDRGRHGWGTAQGQLFSVITALRHVIRPKASPHRPQTIRPDSNIVGVSALPAMSLGSRCTTTNRVRPQPSIPRTSTKRSTPP
ncbi:UNVERIFIED_CONTAM: hypothetical protein NCL1_01269 [Trichonephila clavipes]